VEVAALTGNALADPPRHLDEDKVARYAHILDQLPPVVVFDLGDELLLVDGYHRVEAARRLGQPMIGAQVRQGSRADALRCAVDLAAAERGPATGQALDAIGRRNGKHGAVEQDVAAFPGRGHGWLGQRQEWMGGSGDSNAAF
jgi:hypothetical protein